MRLVRPRFSSIRGGRCSGGGGGGRPPLKNERPQKSCWSFYVIIFDSRDALDFWVNTIAPEASRRLSERRWREGRGRGPQTDDFLTPGARWLPISLGRILKVTEYGRVSESTGGPKVTPVITLKLSLTSTDLI